jgi:hypothetical protein
MLIDIIAVDLDRNTAATPTSHFKSRLNGRVYSLSVRFGKDPAITLPHSVGELVLAPA